MIKAMYKYELAKAAGVSLKTFRKWLANDMDTLVQLGYDSKCHLLKPQIVKFLSEKYVIILNNK